MNKRETALQILRILQKWRRIRKNSEDSNYSIEPFIDLVLQIIDNDQPFKMILPAFHCKSINPNSVLGPTPDGAEEEAIENLSRLCEEIKAAYNPGCELLIVHEGHFYSDINITPSDRVIDEYENCIHKMTTCPMIHYSNIMHDHFNPSYEEARKTIFTKYMHTLLDVRVMVTSNETIRDKYIAYKTFIVHEFAPILMTGFTKREIRDYSRTLAYQWVQRYLIFKQVCSELFKNYFRLSVLAYPSKSKAFSINLIINTSEFGLPWFNVLLKKNNGKMELIKKSQAEKMGYKINYKNDKRIVLGK